MYPVWPLFAGSKHLSGVKFSDRKASLKQKNRDARRRILPFVTQYHPALPNLDITNEEMAPHTESTTAELEIFTEPPIISHYKLENPWKTFWLKQSDKGITQSISEPQESRRFTHANFKE